MNVNIFCFDSKLNIFVLDHWSDKTSHIFVRGNGDGLWSLMVAIFRHFIHHTNNQQVNR